MNSINRITPTFKQLVEIPKKQVTKEKEIAAEDIPFKTAGYLRGIDKISDREFSIYSATNKDGNEVTRVHVPDRLVNSKSGQSLLTGWLDKNKVEYKIVN